MGDPLETRRKRLAYRSRHRGTKELDLYIGAFVEQHLNAMTEAQLDRLEALLEVPEPLLYDWLTGHATPPAEHDNDVTRMLLDFQPVPRVPDMRPAGS